MDWRLARVRPAWLALAMLALLGAAAGALEVGFPFAEEAFRWADTRFEGPDAMKRDALWAGGFVSLVGAIGLSWVLMTRAVAAQARSRLYAAWFILAVVLGAILLVVANFYGDLALAKFDHADNLGDQWQWGAAEGEAAAAAAYTWKGSLWYAGSAVYLASASLAAVLGLLAWHAEYAARLSPRAPEETPAEDRPPAMP